MGDPGLAQLRCSERLVAILAECGVRHAVISPGSRSTPLALACLRHPRIDTRVVIDERSAAFLALGIGRGTGTPALVIATSGSAPGHWLPAAMEANHGAVPLLLLSADRPPELVGWGANQTTEQQHLFGGQVRTFHTVETADDSEAGLRRVAQVARRAFQESRWPLPGPVHLNLPFREPLLPERLPPPASGEPSPPLPRPAPPPPDPAQTERLLSSLGSGAGLIVCGPGDRDLPEPDALCRLAGRLDAPILADPLSGLRFGGHDRSRLLVRYDAWLRAADTRRRLRPAWILRFGAMPVSRWLGQWLAEAARDCPLWLVDPAGRWRDPDHTLHELVTADPTALCTALEERIPPASGEGWLRRLAPLEEHAARCADGATLEGEVTRRLLERLPPHSLLLAGNSMPIRDLDGFGGSLDKPLGVVANRGLSGIDGHLSTLQGLAIARRGERGLTVALMGDLTFCHDLGALTGGDRPDALVVLFDNGGGGIFRHLPQAGLEDFERAWLTPPAIDLEHLAATHRLPWRRVNRLEELDAALDELFGTEGLRVLQVVVDGEASAAAHRRYWRKVGEVLLSAS